MSKLLAMSKDLSGFVRRLNEILDDKGIPTWGRQRFMSIQFHVSQPSAKKWMDGKNYPEMDKLVEIARWGRTTVDWLVSGQGLKTPIDQDLNPTILEVLDLLLNEPPVKQETAKNVIKALLGKNQKH